MPLFQMLFGLNGRIRRRDFWLYSGLNGLVALIVVVVCLGITVARTIGNDNLQAVSQTVMILPWLMVPFVWIAVALNIKRLHDLGRSYRWWRMNLIPVAGWIWTFVECGLRDGMPGPNPYGPSPKPVRSEDVF
ncbi:DUF805 domain-containing protein [Asticcacaulis solisilvae]|uniref:DUF805 domain-containing protein n=1 Tax=Asticcacaulis solisilvae TaxID=1217274 RepID=UPI003FD75365